MHPITLALRLATGYRLRICDRNGADHRVSNPLAPNVSSGHRPRDERLGLLPSRPPGKLEPVRARPLGCSDHHALAKSAGKEEKRYKASITRTASPFENQELGVAKLSLGGTLTWMIWAELWSPDHAPWSRDIGLKVASPNHQGGGGGDRALLRPNIPERDRDSRI
jgi:hypothetical protein